MPDGSKPQRKRISEKSDFDCNAQQKLFFLFHPMKLSTDSTSISQSFIKLFSFFLFHATFSRVMRIVTLAIVSAQLKWHRERVSSSCAWKCLLSMMETKILFLVRKAYYQWGFFDFLTDRAYFCIYAHDIMVTMYFFLKSVLEQKLII